MTQQFSATLRNYWANGYEGQIGASPKLRLYTGSPPADCATSASGTQLGEGTLPSDWMTSASAGSVSKNGTWTVSISTGGVVGYYRIYDSAGTTCHEQGVVGQALGKVTTASTSANSNVLTFADTNGVSVGQPVSGTGIPSDAVVRDKTSTTVTISCAATQTISSGATIVFGSGGSVDMRLANTTVSAGQTVTIDAKTLTMPGA